MSATASDPAASGMFDRLAAKAKQALGHLSGNTDLAEEGQLQEQKVEGCRRCGPPRHGSRAGREAAAIAAAEEANRLKVQRVQAQQDEVARQAQIDRERLAADAEADRRAAAEGPPPLDNSSSTGRSSTEPRPMSPPSTPKPSRRRRRSTGKRPGHGRQPMHSMARRPTSSRRVAVVISNWTTPGSPTSRTSYSNARLPLTTFEAIVRPGPEQRRLAAHGCLRQVRGCGEGSRRESSS